MDNKIGQTFYMQTFLEIKKLKENSTIKEKKPSNLN